MKTIHQKNERDCGVACLAMLGRISYRDAHEFLAGLGKTKTVSSGFIVEGLKNFGRKPRHEKCKPFKKSFETVFDCDALLSVRMLVKNDHYGHWVVWDSEFGKIRDPYEKCYPLALKSFLLVD